jgi:hypothetical protein
VDCYEALDHVSSAVDNCLDEKIVKEFKTHTGVCSKCRNIYELEALTKRFAQSRLKPMPAPGYLNSRITSQILTAGLSGFSGQKKNNRIINVPKYIFTATSLVAASILVVILFSVREFHLHTSPIDNNIIHQAYNTYDSVVEGRIIPAFETDCPIKLGSYFKNISNSAVTVPKLKGCSIVGGRVAEYSGKRIFHVFYKTAECVIHCSLVDFDLNHNHEALVLPDDAIDSLKKNGWYFANEHKCCSVIVWLKDNRLCTATAELQKEKLFAYLNDGEQQW